MVGEPVEDTLEAVPDRVGVLAGDRRVRVADADLRVLDTADLLVAALMSSGVPGLAETEMFSSGVTRSKRAPGSDPLGASPVQSKTVGMNRSMPCRLVDPKL